MSAKKLGIVFPPVADVGVPLDVARELAKGLTVLFSGTDSTSALSFLLVGVLNLAAKTLPRAVLDGIYVHETVKVYGHRKA